MKNLFIKIVSLTICFSLLFSSSPLIYLSPAYAKCDSDDQECKDKKKAKQSCKDADNADACKMERKSAQDKIADAQKQKQAGMTPAVAPEETDNALEAGDIAWGKCKEAGGDDDSCKVKAQEAYLRVEKDHPVDPTTKQQHIVRDLLRTGWLEQAGGSEGLSWEEAERIRNESDLASDLTFKNTNDQDEYNRKIQAFAKEKNITDPNDQTLQNYANQLWMQARQEGKLETKLTIEQAEALARQRAAIPLVTQKLAETRPSEPAPTEQRPPTNAEWKQALQSVEICQKSPKYGFVPADDGCRSCSTGSKVNCDDANANLIMNSEVCLDRGGFCDDETKICYSCRNGKQTQASAISRENAMFLYCEANEIKCFRGQPSNSSDFTRWSAENFVDSICQNQSCNQTEKATQKYYRSLIQGSRSSLSAFDQKYRSLIEQVSIGGGGMTVERFSSEVEKLTANVTPVTTEALRETEKVLFPQTERPIAFGLRSASEIERQFQAIDYKLQREEDQAVIMEAGKLGSQDTDGDGVPDWAELLARQNGLNLDPATKEEALSETRGGTLTGPYEISTDLGQFLKKAQEAGIYDPKTQRWIQNIDFTQYSQFKKVFPTLTPELSSIYSTQHLVPTNVYNLNGEMKDSDNDGLPDWTEATLAQAGYGLDPNKFNPKTIPSTGVGRRETIHEGAPTPEYTYDQALTAASRTFIQGVDENGILIQIPLYDASRPEEERWFNVSKLSEEAKSNLLTNFQRQSSYVRNPLRLADIGLPVPVPVLGAGIPVSSMYHWHWDTKDFEGEWGYITREGPEGLYALTQDQTKLNSTLVIAQQHDKIYSEEQYRQVQTDTELGEPDAANPLINYTPGSIDAKKINAYIAVTHPEATGCGLVSTGKEGLAERNTCPDPVTNPQDIVREMAKLGITVTVSDIPALKKIYDDLLLYTKNAARSEEKSRANQSLTTFIGETLVYATMDVAFGEAFRLGGKVVGNLLARRGAETLTQFLERTAAEGLQLTADEIPALMRSGPRLLVADSIPIGSVDGVARIVYNEGPDVIVREALENGQNISLQGIKGVVVGNSADVIPIGSFGSVIKVPNRNPFPALIPNVNSAIKNLSDLPTQPLHSIELPEIRVNISESGNLATRLDKIIGPNGEPLIAGAEGIRQILDNPNKLVDLFSGLKDNEALTFITRGGNQINVSPSQANQFTVIARDLSQATIARGERAAIQKAAEEEAERIFFSQPAIVDLFDLLEKETLLVREGDSPLQTLARLARDDPNYQSLLDTYTKAVKALGGDTPQIIIPKTPSEKLAADMADILAGMYGRGGGEVVEAGQPNIFRRALTGIQDGLSGIRNRLPGLDTKEIADEALPGNPKIWTKEGTLLIDQRVSRLSEAVEQLKKAGIEPGTEVTIGQGGKLYVWTGENLTPPQPTPIWRRAFNATINPKDESSFISRSYNKTINPNNESSLFRQIRPDQSKIVFGRYPTEDAFSVRLKNPQGEIAKIGFTADQVFGDEALFKDKINWAETMLRIQGVQDEEAIRSVVQEVTKIRELGKIPDTLPIISHGTDPFVSNFGPIKFIRDTRTSLTNWWDFKANPWIASRKDALYSTASSLRSKLSFKKQIPQGQNYDDVLTRLKMYRGGLDPDQMSRATDITNSILQKLKSGTPLEPEELSLLKVRISIFQHMATSRAVFPNDLLAKLEPQILEAVGHSVKLSDEIPPFAYSEARNVLEIMNRQADRVGAQVKRINIDKALGETTPVSGRSSTDTMLVQLKGKKSYMGLRVHDVSAINADSLKDAREFAGVIVHEAGHGEVPQGKYYFDLNDPLSFQEVFNEAQVMEACKEAGYPDRMYRNSLYTLGSDRVLRMADTMNYYYGNEDGTRMLIEAARTGDHLKFQQAYDAIPQANRSYNFETILKRYSDAAYHNGKAPGLISGGQTTGAGIRDTITNALRSIPQTFWGATGGRVIKIGGGLIGGVIGGTVALTRGLPILKNLYNRLNIQPIQTPLPQLEKPTAKPQTSPHPQSRQPVEESESLANTIKTISEEIKIGREESKTTGLAAPIRVPQTTEPGELNYFLPFKNPNVFSDEQLAQVKQEIINIVNRSWPNNILSLTTDPISNQAYLCGKQECDAYDYVAYRCREAGWNPAFCLTILIEETGAGAEGGALMGCWPSNNRRSLQEEVDCLTESSQLRNANAMLEGKPLTYEFPNSSTGFAQFMHLYRFGSSHLNLNQNWQDFTGSSFPKRLRDVYSWFCEEGTPRCSITELNLSERQSKRDHTFSFVKPILAKGEDSSSAILPSSIYKNIKLFETIGQEVQEKGEISEEKVQQLVDEAGYLPQKIEVKNGGRIIQATTDEFGLITLPLGLGLYSLKVDPVSNYDIFLPTEKIRVTSSGYLNLEIGIKEGKGEIKIPTSQLGKNSFFEKIKNIFKKGQLPVITTKAFAQTQENQPTAPIQNQIQGSIKVSLFYDKNGNGQKDEGENLLPWAGVALALEKETEETSYNLLEGWNLVAFPIIPQSFKTASELVTDVAKQGGYVTTVSRWNGSAWEEYIQRGNEPFGQDFTIEPGVPYLLRNHQHNTNWIVSGLPIKQPVPLKLKEGWNGFSIPYSEKSYTALKVIDALNSQECSDKTLSCIDSREKQNSELVERYYSGLWGIFSRVHYSSTNIKEYGLDFEILSQEGYFTKLNHDINWTP